MFKKFFISFIVMFAGVNIASAQTDSTDLSFYMGDVVLETALDTMLFDNEDYESLNLDFTISDTVTFEKVHVELKLATTNEVVYRKIYTLSALESSALIDGWDVGLPFGNWLNSEAYEVCIIVESYDGTLGSTIKKTLIP